MPRRLVIIVARRGWSLRMSHYLAAILPKISAIRGQTAATRRWRSRRDRRDSLKLCNICRWGFVLRSITAARIIRGPASVDCPRPRPTGAGAHSAARRGDSTYRPQRRGALNNLAYRSDAYRETHRAYRRAPADHRSSLRCYCRNR